MNLLKKFLFALALCGATLAARAAAPQNGVDFLTLATPQNTDAGKKVEVIEFFAYYCPHCHSFEPSLTAWARKQGEQIVLRRVHVGNGDSVAAQQRLFFTLEAMGLLNALHDKVFHAIHVERQRLGGDERVFDFIEKQGVERKKFIDAYRSFGVAARVRNAGNLMAAYKIDSWPTLAIDGRFATSPSLAGKTATNEAELHAQTLATMDYLVAKAKAEKK